MTLQEAIRARVHAAYRKSGLTISQLAERTGLSITTCERLSAGHLLSLHTYDIIARNLRVQVVVVADD